MTAFFKKKNTAPKIEEKKTAKVAIIAPTADSADSQEKKGGLPLATVLIRPHVTEKATDFSTRGVYIFEINKLANKMHVRQAVEKLYKVKPIKIAIVNGKAKFMKNLRTGRIQTKTGGMKKALVYLKSGDKIGFA